VLKTCHLQKDNKQTTLHITGYASHQQLILLQWASNTHSFYTDQI